MSGPEVLGRLVRSAVIELVRTALVAEPANVAALRGLLAEAERARVEGELVDVLRSALNLVR